MHWLWASGTAAMIAGTALVWVRPWLGYGAFMLGLATVLSWTMRPRQRARDAIFTCKPGAIRSRETGLIRARDLEGATTARFGDRLTLLLAHRRRRRAPMILELEDDAALAAICKSLGIGHHGFGHIDFVAKPVGDELTMRFLGAISIVTALAMLIREPAIIALGSLILFSALCTMIILAITRFFTPPPFARITSGGVFLPTALFVPFEVIEDVKLLADHVLFQVRNDRGVTSLKMPIKDVSMRRVGTTRDELEHLVAQIRAASERAHGQYVLKSAPEALATRLARGKDESESAWLARIDMFSMGAGYRALSAEPPELWALLEDPEAPADVRAAAARVLHRVDKDALRVRVVEVLATVRDEDTRTRIADSISSDDDEEPAPDSQSAAHS